jgi:hypothetical protein
MFKGGSGNGWECFHALLARQTWEGFQVAVDGGWHGLGIDLGTMGMDSTLRTFTQFLETQRRRSKQGDSKRQVQG